MHEKRDLIALADIVSSVTNAFLVSYVIHIANTAARIEMNIEKRNDLPRIEM